MSMPGARIMIRTSRGANVRFGAVPKLRNCPTRWSENRAGPRGRGARLSRLRQGRILHERRQKIVGPADDIGVADDGVELFPSRLALSERHVHRDRKSVG